MALLLSGDSRVNLPGGISKNLAFRLPWKTRIVNLDLICSNPNRNVRCLARKQRAPIGANPCKFFYFNSLPVNRILMKNCPLYVEIGLQSKTFDMPAQAQN